MDPLGRSTHILDYIPPYCKMYACISLVEELNMARMR
jgi:hypothetical protein